MKQTICKKVQEHLASGEPLPEESRRHTGLCRDCGDHSDFVRAVMAAEKELPPVPEFLSESVRKEAVHHLLSRRRMTVTRILIPAAAACILCTALCFHFLPERSGAAGRTAVSGGNVSQAWSREYDETLFNMGYEVSSASDVMPENLDSVTI